MAEIIEFKNYLKTNYNKQLVSSIKQNNLDLVSMAHLILQGEINEFIGVIKLNDRYIEVGNLPDTPPF